MTKPIKERVMPTLLVQSCSQSKNPAASPGPALDIYDGYYYKIIKKSRREGEFDPQLDIAILSAKYGLLDADEEIGVYDQRMTDERAAELRPAVTDALQSRITSEVYDAVVVNAGMAYQAAIDESALNVPVQYISGGGIGEKGHYLKRFIRGESAVLEEAV
jgi:cytoplasmic iron level regulating protein YaaA (DUF328/UPF0246 family)